MRIWLDDFLYMFNKSIPEGKVPDSWNCATVIPITKMQNSSNASDLQPLSLLPLPGKVLERFVHKDVLKYLESNDVLSNNQFGFFILIG